MAPPETTLTVTSRRARPSDAADLARFIERGKCEVSFSVESQEAAKKTVINRQLAKAYFEELKMLDAELGISTPNYLQIILPLPDVMMNDTCWRSPPTRPSAAGASRAT